MTGRLLPASGGPAIPLDMQEVVKAAKAKAIQDVSTILLKRTVTGLARKGVKGPEKEKKAFLRPLLAAGRRGAAALASKGGRTGRVGKFLQRDVRSPVQVARTGPTSAAVSARSPLAPTRAATPPRIPKDAGGPYRAPGKVAPPPVSKAQDIPDMTRHAKPIKSKGKKEVKPRSLTRALLPGALMAGTAYGLYKGIPAAANFASQASNAPMAYNFGHQQYQYGYGPGGQAQF